MATETTNSELKPYYVPHGSMSPSVINLGVFLLALGFCMSINGLGGTLIWIAGFVVLLYGTVSWVMDMIHESEGGSYNAWEDRSYRIGMGYFIWGELMLFAGFIGGLFYLRNLSIPHLQSYTDLYANYASQVWPASGAGPAGHAFEALTASGTPTVNAVLLVVSALTVTWARMGLCKMGRGQIATGLALTACIGLAFVVSQFMEYASAAHHGVTSATGVYGSAFYMLTGFHLLHMIIGMIMIGAILLRNGNLHFAKGPSFILDGMMWYWNFLIVGPGLLIYAYFYVV